MKNILILQPVMAHYRLSFFECLLANQDYNFSFIAGKKYQNIKSIDSISFIALNHFNFRFFSHQFYYLKNSIQQIKSCHPDIIISGGVDFHLIHTIFIFVYFRIILRKEFIWWTHATTEKHSKFGKWIRKQFYKRSSGILTYSRKGKDDLLKLGLKNPIEVLGNSINSEDYGFLNDNSSHNSPQEKTFTIIFSGRITEGKKIEILLQALKKIHSEKKFIFECIIIGDGDINKLKALAIKLGLEEIVNFVGEKYNEEIVEYFTKADLMVYPGGIGLSILQAHSYGIPVITSDNLSMHGPEIELLSSGFTGDLYTDKDYSNLADKIEIWHNKIQTSKSEISKLCIQQIIDYNYLPQEMCNTLISFIKNRT